MKTVVALRHVLFEDLGTLAGTLEKRGFAIRYVDAGVDDLSHRDLIEADLMVVLGGPIGAYDEDLHPFLHGELAVIGERLALQRPILGICLGAQLMARALGAAVTPMGGRKEIGYGPVSLTADGEASVLARLDKDIPVLHWHGDEFQIPSGAKHLALTEVCNAQAFEYQGFALGLQFHLEADPARIEQWLVGHSVELAASGTSVRKLRADAVRGGPLLAKAAQDVFNAWINRLDAGQSSKVEGGQQNNLMLKLML